MAKCRWCDRDGLWPYICMNTRDMTDRAIDGNETCFEALAKQGWGESGERYVRLNKAAVAEKRARLDGTSPDRSQTC